jgi:hypothetical protein
LVEGGEEASASCWVRFNRNVCATGLIGIVWLCALFAAWEVDRSIVSLFDSGGCSQSHKMFPSFMFTRVIPVVNFALLVFTLDRTYFKKPRVEFYGISSLFLFVGGALHIFSITLFGSFVVICLILDAFCLLSAFARNSLPRPIFDVFIWLPLFLLSLGLFVNLYHESNNAAFVMTLCPFLPRPKQCDILDASWSKWQLFGQTLCLCAYCMAISPLYAQSLLQDY